MFTNISAVTMPTVSDTSCTCKFKMADGNWK